MNPTTRRTFLGTAASMGAAAAIAAFHTKIVSAQSGAAPVTDQIYAQITQGLQRLLNADPVGGHQLATTFRIYAAILPDDQFRSFLQSNGPAVLTTKFDGATLRAHAQMFGFPVDRLPASVDANVTPDAKQQALSLLAQNGFTGAMQSVANGLDDVAARIQAANKPLQPVRQIIGNCCDSAYQLMENAEYAMAVACAASALDPALAEICAAASATFLAASAAYWACVAINC